MMAMHHHTANCSCEPRLLGEVLAHRGPMVPPGMGFVTVLDDSPPATDDCLCGDLECLHAQCGYWFCRPCDEHHRPPECAIDEHGRALSADGTPWEDLP